MHASLMMGTAHAVALKIKMVIGTLQRTKIELLHLLTLSFKSYHQRLRMVILEDELEIQVAYAIGVANPVSVFVDSHGTGKLSDEELAEVVKKEFDLRPYAIIKTLDLRKPVFKKTAAYGHFGYKGFSWEQTDRVDDLKKYL